MLALLFLSLLLIKALDVHPRAFFSYRLLLERGGGKCMLGAGGGVDAECDQPSVPSEERRRGGRKRERGDEGEEG